MLDRILIGASSTETTDPNFKNVTLLLHGDGSNGAQNNTFIDSSTNNFTITRNGNTTQGSFSPYGSNWSNYFDGTGDYLTAPDDAALQLGSSDFTIEFWVNFSVVPGASQGATLVSKFNTSNTGYEVILYNNTMYFQAQTASIGMTYAWTPTAGRWYHIAWTRSGSNSYGFIDGALVASTSGASGSITNLAQALQIGRRGNDTFYLNGYMSNVRVVKGTAVYTSAFTPSTTPLTAITNTSLLTCADNRFRDGSANNFTITRNGDVKVTNFSPFAPSAAYSTTTNGGSAYFDGSGDYLSASSNTAFAFGTGDFAVECWVYRLNSNGTGLFESRGGSAGFLWYIDGGNQYPRFYDQNTAAHFTATVTVPVGAWTHLAVTRSSGTLYFWVNGQAAGSNAYTVNVGSTATLRFYASNDAAAYLGYGSNMRAVKGSAVYTAAFTPPSSPVTAITNTSLLLNATNAAIFDNSMKNDLETVGNAQISTSVKKFGTGSMYFDGTGDYLFMPNSQDLAFGTGNFTIELWAYIAGNSAVNPEGNRNAAMASSINASSPTGIEFNLLGNGSTTGTGLSFANWVGGSQSLISASSSISQNAWHHFAVVRNGTTTTLYVDGTSIGSGTLSNQTINPALPLQIGQQNHGSFPHAFNGYIDDFRITKGVARYTANFTAPTAPFPNK